MTDRELQLMAELDNEQKNKASLEKQIANKRDKLKASEQKISDLNLSIKEEQLNSIRESIDKNGFDFEAFRSALEKGQIKTFGSLNKKEYENSAVSAVETIAKEADISR